MKRGKQERYIKDEGELTKYLLDASFMTLDWRQDERIRSLLVMSCENWQSLTIVF